MDYEIMYLRRVNFSDWQRNETIGITESEGQAIREFFKTVAI